MLLIVLPFSYNLESSIWNVVPVSKGPLQRYGHTIALYQVWTVVDDIYMYGGKIETNTGNVTDELWIFNIPSQTWSTRIPAVVVHGQQYAVEGHSAHIVELDSRDIVMIVIFGYSVIYGYTSSVQEYYISKFYFVTFLLIVLQHSAGYLQGQVTDSS
ncbi:hypothetical protein lerEdw1_007884 [Lerista edwardsae]|nr:hypothetical protein lerEdw1_007884 [Lerista edwardsae]